MLYNCSNELTFKLENVIILHAYQNIVKDYVIDFKSDDGLLREKVVNKDIYECAKTALHLYIESGYKAEIEFTLDLYTNIFSVTSLSAIINFDKE